jgi:glutathione S-transferase
MAKSEVKLLGAWPSPFVMRARIALNIKAVEYEFLQETLEPKSQLLIQSNPVYKKIPVLIHADKPICESLVIVQYIDDFWTSGPSILPSDPYDRAIHRFWAAYLDDKVLIFFIFFMMVFFKYTLYLLYIYELDLMLKSKV